MNRLSILLPTIGRASLEKTLNSIYEAGFRLDVDQLIIAADGRSAGNAVVKVFESLTNSTLDATTLPQDCALTVIEDGPHRDWGHTPRNLVMPKATGDWILSIDDDDGYVENAFDIIRAALVETKKRVPHIFRMKWRGNQYLWQKEAIEQLNISTQMICVPNDPAMLGAWGNRYQGDLDFLKSTVAKYNGEVVWRKEVIANYCCW